MRLSRISSACRLVAPIHRDAGERAVRKQHRVRQRRALDDVQAIGEQRLRGGGLVALEQRRRHDRREHARDDTAAPGAALGVRQRGAHRRLGLVRVAVPQVAHADEHAPERSAMSSDLFSGPRPAGGLRAAAPCRCRRRTARAARRGSRAPPGRPGPSARSAAPSIAPASPPRCRADPRSTAAEPPTSAASNRTSGGAIGSRAIALAISSACAGRSPSAMIQPEVMRRSTSRAMSSSGTRSSHSRASASMPCLARSQRQRSA